MSDVCLPVTLLAFSSLQIPIFAGRSAGQQQQQQTWQPAQQ
jgi:hypothetical protein